MFVQFVFRPLLLVLSVSLPPIPQAAIPWVLSESNCGKLTANTSSDSLRGSGWTGDGTDDTGGAWT